MGSFKHNKKRNTGLIYEFLVRRMASQLLEKDAKGYARSLEITKKYFGDGSVLRQEKELFDAVSSSRGVPDNVARYIVAKVKEHARALDAWKIEVKKSNLIKELNYAFGKDFFSKHRINEYKFLASVQLVIDACKREGKSTINEGVQLMQLEEAIVKYMTIKPQHVQQIVHNNGQVDKLVCAIAAKNFQKKYGTSLNKEQKFLIESFMRCEMSGAKDELIAKLIEEKSRISLELHKADSMKEVRDDKVMHERMQEAQKKLASLDVTSASDDVVQEIMLYQKLTEELKSDD